MLDVTSRRAPLTTGPLDRHVAAAKSVPVAGLRALPSAARFVFRGREAAIGPAGTAFGVELPREACRFNNAQGRFALWLGPDEWLLLAPALSPAPIFEAIEAAVGGAPHSLVDVSARSVGIEISGAQAARVLNHGCPLDLHISAFPVGMSTRTLLGKAEIVLMRTGPDVFQIDVWRSFASYVWKFLEEARQEFE